MGPAYAGAGDGEGLGDGLGDGLALPLPIVYGVHVEPVSDETCSPAVSTVARQRVGPAGSVSVAPEPMSVTFSPEAAYTWVSRPSSAWSRTRIGESGSTALA